MKKLLFLVVIISLLSACTPDLSTIPRRSTPSDSASVVSRTPVPSTQVQTPTPNPITTIYVVDKGVREEWGLQAAVNSWQRAKFTDIIFVKVCPADWKIACVTISEVTNMSMDFAGEATFNLTPKQMTIHLNALVTWTTEAEKQTTVCHEFGHILGLAHITFSQNSCMWNGGTYQKWPRRATNLDLKMVDRLGSWDIEKMYDSSSKDVAIPVAPK